MAHRARAYFVRLVPMASSLHCTPSEPAVPSEGWLLAAAREGAVWGTTGGRRDMHNLRRALAQRTQALAPQQAPPDVEAAQHQRAMPQCRCPQCGALRVETHDQVSAMRTCSRGQGLCAREEH